MKLDAFRLVVVALAAFVATPASPAAAQTALFRNFGSTGVGYSGIANMYVAGPDHPTGNFDSAALFVTPNSTTYRINAVRLPFFTSIDAGSMVRWSLAADEGGNPGAALESVDVPLSRFPTSWTEGVSQLSTIDFSGSTLLMPGQRYWLVYDILNGAGYAGALVPTSGSPGTEYRFREDAGWENPGWPAPAFEILGTESEAAVPEPGGRVLCMPALALIALVLGRRRSPASR